MANKKSTDRVATTRTLESRRELDHFLREPGSKREEGRFLGAGKACDDPAQIAASIVDGLNCGIEELEVVAQNRAYFQNPMTPSSLANFFKPEINPFEIGVTEGAADQAQINIDGSEMDCNVLITHMGFHLVPPPHTLLVEGGYWTPPPTSSGSGPVVPNAWTLADAKTDGTGTLGLTAGQALTKSYLDTGEWACDFFYELCRAYEWLWKIGNNILVQAPLTKIASIRGAAQPWTSGQHLKPFAQDVADYNAFARNNSGTGIFLPRNATRDGSANVTSGATNSSTFSPYGYYAEQATIGGPGVQELCQNPTLYELCTAQLFPRGVKLGSKFNEIDALASARAQRYAAWSNGNILNPDVNVTSVGSGTAPVFTEITAGNADVTLQEPVGRVSCKIGDFYLVATLMGHRVSQTFYNKCLTYQDALCQQVKSQTSGRVSLAIMAQ